MIATHALLAVLLADLDTVDRTSRAVARGHLAVPEWLAPFVVYVAGRRFIAALADPHEPVGFTQPN